MDGSIGFSTTQSVGKSPDSSFTVQNKIDKIFGTLHNLKEKKWTLGINKKKSLNE